MSWVPLRRLCLSPKFRPRFSSLDSTKCCQLSAIPSGRLKKSASDSSDRWVRIYRFPLIVTLRSFSRFKIWQTAFSGVLAPFVITAHQAGHLSIEFAVGSVVGASLASFTLFALSYFTRNLVGIVSFDSTNPTQLRIGRLSFWGRRINDFVEITDIVPAGDVGEEPSDVWFRVYRYSEPKNPYFFVLRFGGIDSPDLFRQIFGVANNAN